MQHQLRQENAGLRGSDIAGDWAVSAITPVSEITSQQVVKGFQGQFLANMIIAKIAPAPYDLLIDSRGIIAGFTMEKLQGRAQSLAFISDPVVLQSIAVLRQGGVKVDVSPFGKNCMRLDDGSYKLLDLSI